MSLESFRARRLRLKVEARNVGGESRSSDLIGTRCGSALPTDMQTNRLLQKLTQLSEFGLAPIDPPLLKPMSRDLRFTTIIE
jgi:hypothetical protein